MPASSSSSAPLAPFAAATAPRRSILQRVLRRPDADAATQAVAALFAETDPADVPPAAVDRAMADQGVHGDATVPVVEQLFVHAVAAFLADDQLADHEIAYLDRLRAPLRIDEARARALALDVARPRLEAEARAAYADEELTSAEFAKLQRLARALGVSDDALGAICVDVVAPILGAALDRVMADRRYSPVEEERVRARARALGVPRLALDPATERALAHFRRLWEIETGTRPVVAAPELEPGEVCHLAVPARWFEPRPRTGPVADAGFTTSIHVARGIRFRAAAISPQRVPRAERQELDVGTVYVTDARVLFRGGVIVRSVPHGGLLGIEVFADAVRLVRGGGRSPDIVFTDGAADVETAAVLLAELLGARPTSAA